MKDLVYLRKDSGLKASKVASLLGISRQQLYNLERGKYELGKLKVEKLSKVYEKSEEEIVKAWEVMRSE